MSRIDCISNRNIRIISAYLEKGVGIRPDSLFHDLPYPANRYRSAAEFFLNEDEWTTYDNFHRIFRRAKELSGEPYFYFNCGASSAVLGSWGRFDYFKRVFAGPDEGFKNLPFFNSNINDTKDIEVVRPPFHDRSSKKVRVILKVQYHEDVDVEKDYICDSYRRGMVSSIPTIWGLAPAVIRQPLNPYDPEVLLNREPEFAGWNLRARFEDGILTIQYPPGSGRVKVGKRVFLEPEPVEGRYVFLGRYTELSLIHI